MLPRADRDSEYAAGGLAEVRERFGITQLQLARVGSALDDSPASESFLATLWEFECLRKHHFETKAQARRVVANWIDGFSDRMHGHSYCEGVFAPRPPGSCCARPSPSPSYPGPGHMAPVRDDTATMTSRGVRGSPSPAPATDAGARRAADSGPGAAAGAPTPPLPAKRTTVYQCDSCGERALGDRSAKTARPSCDRVGPGGPYPHCDELVALQDIINDDQLSQKQVADGERTLPLPTSQTSTVCGGKPTTLAAAC